MYDYQRKANKGEFLTFNGALDVASHRNTTTQSSHILHAPPRLPVALRVPLK